VADVKFQPALLPQGCFAESKHYFSEKHKLYGFKVEVSVAYPRFAIMFSQYWAVLVDKGYQGAASLTRAVHPKKKPRNGRLTAVDLRRNERVSSDRVLVENYFGRMNNYGTACSLLSNGVRRSLI
jgi:hypothetical protein